MLRRRLSSGLLRASFAQQPAAAIPAVPALPARYANSNRGLASAVLLSSRENWANKTVKNLKEALAQRGLSQTGKKTTLVERLRDYETVQSSTSGSRGISSSAIAFKSSPSSSSTETEDQAPLPEAPKVEVASGVEANVNVVPEIVVPDVEPALAPGLPEGKTDLQEAPPTLDIKMPEFEDKAPEFALPPSEPDNFESKAEDSLSPPAEIQSSAPKVMTVDPSLETRHSLHETVASADVDVANAETVVESSKESLEQLPSLSSIFTMPSLGGLGKTLDSAFTLPEGNEAKPFKPIERGLNSEEKTGAYILLGTIAAGFFLGGAVKKDDEGDEEDVKERVDEAAKKAAH